MLTGCKRCWPWATMRKPCSCTGQYLLTGGEDSTRMLSSWWSRGEGGGCTVTEGEFCNTLSWVKRKKYDPISEWFSVSTDSALTGGISWNCFLPMEQSTMCHPQQRLPVPALCLSWQQWRQSVWLRTEQLTSCVPGTVQAMWVWETSKNWTSNPSQLALLQQTNKAVRNQQCNRVSRYK